MSVLSAPTRVGPPPSPSKPLLPRPSHRLESLASLSLMAVALTIGLGDIAQTNPLTAAVGTLVRVLPLLAVALALLACLSSGRRPSFPSSVALPATVWLAVLVGSAAFAESHRSEALASLARPASGALLAWAVSDVCRRRSTWRRVLRAPALGGLAIAGAALAEATGQPAVRQVLDSLRDGSVPIGDVPRVAASLSHPNEAAVLLELTLPLLLAWVWTASRGWRRVLIAAAAATLLALVLTFSRAGILAGLWALATMAVLAKPRRSADRLPALAAVALVVPLALSWAALVDPGLDRRMLAGLDESSTVQPPRTQFWSVALDMARQHPLLGVGPDNFRWRFSDYSGVAEDNFGIHAHDQYLETLADTGILGLVSLIWLLAALLREALQQVRSAAAEWPWRVALVASLSAWLVHAGVDDFERFWPSSILFWLLAGLSLSRARTSSD